MCHAAIQASASRQVQSLLPFQATANNGEYEDAVTAARRAIDDMGISWISEKAAIQTPKEQRSLEERLSALRHALHALASPAAHGDPAAASIKWDRENALAVIAGVAALAACKVPGNTN